MDKKILITGASGFVGGYLLDNLSKQSENKIFGTYFSDDSFVELKKNYPQLNNGQFLKVDLNDKENVFKLIEQVKPDVIYHLAAFSSPWDSFRNPVETINNNINGQINLFEAVRASSLLDTKILVVSSADIYGVVDKKHLPIDEETPLNPTSPYAVSKIAQDYLGLQYFFSYNLKIIRVRPFNHVGPKQTDKFVISAFAKKIIEVEKSGKPGVISVGNLDARRDFTDVRDMVKAYQMIIEKGAAGEVYNIGSGKSYKIADVLEKMLALTTAKIEVKNDLDLNRPADNPELLCDASKFIQLTGWKSEIPLEKTLKDTLDYWRNIL
jgi:GDP-4-dehydro-6-deoxy-D-mannose reductase